MIRDSEKLVVFFFFFFPLNREHTDFLIGSNLLSSWVCAHASGYVGQASRGFWKEPGALSCVLQFNVAR